MTAPATGLPRGVPVRNTRGQRWESVKEAALHFGLSRGRMSDVVRLQRAIGGYRLMRADSGDERWKRRKVGKEQS
jgi:hypothetical protein